MEAVVANSSFKPPQLVQPWRTESIGPNLVEFKRKLPRVQPIHEKLRLHEIAKRLTKS